MPLREVVSNIIFTHRAKIAVLRKKSSYRSNCFLKNICLFCFFACYKLHNECCSNRNDNTYCKAYYPVLNKACDYEHYKGDCRNCYGIRNLCGNVNEVVALCAGRGHDGRIGNRGAMVAANSTCKTCGHTDDNELAACGEDAYNDRDKYAECTPRRTCRERKEASNKEDYCRQNSIKACSGTVHKVVYIVFCAEQGRDVFESCGKRENEYCGNHSVEALGKSFHTAFEVEHLAADKVNYRNNERDKTAHGKTNCCICICKSVYKVFAVHDAAYVEERKDRGNDENYYGEKEIEHFAVFIMLGGFFAVFFGFNSVTFFLEAVLVHAHFAVVHADECDSYDKYECEQSIEVVGDSRDEELKAFAFGRVGGNCRSPAGNRSNHTNGSRRGVDYVSELRTGNLFGICYGAHNGTDSKAVEVVVDKDEYTENESSHSSAYLRFDVRSRPSAERRRAACVVNESHEHTELYKEDEDAGVIGNSCDKSIVCERVHSARKAEVAVEQSTGNDTDEEGAVNLFCDKRECDSYYCGEYSPDRCANSAFTAAGFASERACAFAIFAVCARTFAGAAGERACAAAIGAVYRSVGAVRYARNNEKRNYHNYRNDNGDKFRFFHKISPKYLNFKFLQKKKTAKNCGQGKKP